MAGVPQQQTDSATAHAIAAPAWVPVPNNPSNAPGPSTAPFSGASASSIPLLPRPPGLGSSGATPFSSLQMQTAPQQFVPPGSHQFRPGISPAPGMGTQIGIQVIGGLSNTPSVQLPQGQFQMPLRPGQQPQQLMPSQASSMPYNQQQRPMSTGQPQLQQPLQSLNMFGSAITYPQAQSTYGTTPAATTFQCSTQVQQVQGMQSITQPWQMFTGQTNIPAQHQGIQTGPIASGVSPSALVSSDWQEHTAPDGRRYYYNKSTKHSYWEKPLELMTPTERADASTMWKEFMTGDGRKYYHNKVTKQSTWTMPEEMKLAREKAERGTNVPSIGISEATPAKLPSSPATPISLASSLLPSPETISAAETAITTPVLSVSQEAAAAALPTVRSTNDSVVTDAAPLSVNASLLADPEKEALLDSNGEQEASAQDVEEAIKPMPSTVNVNVGSVSEDKLQPIAEEPLTFTSKTEAKNAFKDLLEAVHVESDWTWEQAMRVIINEKCYGALKTLGERKQAFNEYLAQKKKQDAEAKRLRQKKAREDFLVMLQESKELTSTMRWSKAVSLFSDDPRLNAMGRERERELLFEDYLVDLERKEREKAREERKKNLVEYRDFLEICDFIKVNTQWRKILDKLEDDERCSRLDKIDRLEIFQEYIRDLEKKEEEEKKIQKEVRRRKERKNRDEFRSIMEEHKSCGIVTAHTTWHDYVLKVKDHPAYNAVMTNTLGSTPKELFEDLAEELDRQYHNDKLRIKEAVKAGKIVVTPTWTLDNFKTSIAEAGDLEAVAESSLKLMFEDLIYRAREKEEKKRKHLTEDFIEFLHAEKSISSLSKWEDVEEVIENAPESRALNDEVVRKKLFDEYVMRLQLKSRERDRKRGEEKARKEKEKETERGKEKEEVKEKEREKQKEKEKKENDREKEKYGKRDKESIVDLNETVSYHTQREERNKRDRDWDKDKSRKYRKRHRSRSSDDISSEEDRDEGKRSRKHISDRRKSSRKHGHDSGSDSENRQKQYKRDQDGPWRNGTAEELEDGEVGEDGEIQ